MAKAKKSTKSKPDEKTVLKQIDEKEVVLKSVAQKERELEVLKQFDLNYKFGPAYG